MRIFYVSPLSAPGTFMDIHGSEAQHIRKVLRLEPGDELRLADGQGRVVEARIEECGSESVRVQVIRTVNSAVESPVKITLAQAYLKDRKMDALVRPLTELGIDRWILFAAERSVARPDDRRLAARIERWNRLSREALKQCRRSRIMEIVPAESFAAMLAQASGCDPRLLFWEQQGASFFLETGDRVESVFAAIGPEGGFSPREVEHARRHGFVTAGMGPRILRAETAGITAAVLLQYRFGDLGKNP
ncbi:MAG TPA: RsmE family RNA methyltransferase [Desulfobacterales bacterium]